MIGVGLGAIATGVKTVCCDAFVVGVMMFFGTGGRTGAGGMAAPVVFVAI